MTVGVANKCLTALGNLWVAEGVTFKRKDHVHIRKQMEGYRRLRPGVRRIRHPFCFFMLVWGVKFLVRKNSHNALISAAGLVIGYCFGGRSGEYTSTKYSLSLGDILLQQKHFQWTFDADKNPISLTLFFEKSKTNQHGDKTEIVARDCCCKTKPLCPVHFLLYVRNQVRKRFGRAKPTDAFLRKENGKPLSPDNMNNTIGVIAEELDCDPAFYKQHSLRIGHASDQARNGVPHWIIKKWGRWKSNCWEAIYARLDFRDVAKLTNTSVNDWYTNTAT